MARGFDLDVDSPEKVAPVIRRAAQAFYDSATELSASWQDRGAGRPWSIIAKELDAAADRIEKKLR